jgi:ribosomal protein S27E
MKIQCQNCGRKVTVYPDDDSWTPMQYCRRCGDELPPEEEW